MRKQEGPQQPDPAEEAVRPGPTAGMVMAPQALRLGLVELKALSPSVQSSRSWSFCSWERLKRHKSRSGVKSPEFFWRCENCLFVEGILSNGIHFVTKVIVFSFLKPKKWEFNGSMFSCLFAMVPGVLGCGGGPLGKRLGPWRRILRGRGIVHWWEGVGKSEPDFDSRFEIGTVWWAFVGGRFQLDVEIWDLAPNLWLV